MNQNIAITHEHRGHGGRYVLALDGLESELTYTRNADSITITHTYVPPPHRGKKLALALVARAVEDARAQNLKVVPICWYARAEIERRPEWQDVLQR